MNILATIIHTARNYELSYRHVIKLPSCVAIK